MRKAQKKQAEDFVLLLGQVHDEIRKAVEAGSIVPAMDLLGQCQEGAIRLGELIEKTESDNTDVISLLEGYCELTYRLHEELAMGNPVNSNKVYKKLRKSLFQIESGIRNGIKVRREVVFLPYKASMWDSLESIWKAAQEDPDCDAYVIPIPYYDKNPGGSFRKMHYEGNQYPDGVPVTWYGEYDLDKHHPDIIYIHNPYDDNNLVTSVHPSYYSKELKQFTDLLVYVPYFILGEVDPEDEKAVEGLSKFCAVPGVVNADKVVVQSEAMRQAYIKVMTRLMSQHGYGRKYWEDKILGIGSPKVDKVLATRREDLELPEEWERIIRKSDGSRKKVIFYNTSVTTLLQHNERYLEKMRDVFGVFHENRDDVAMLWRPHPLMQATIESMRPGLWKEYIAIVNRYREEGWGIYDDTTDIDRAVCLSDVYYGDSSSVIQLFQKLGKRCVTQNIYLKNHVPDSIAATEVITYTNGSYWYVPYWGKALYRMDSGTFETERVEVFKEKGISGLFCGIVCYQEKLLFAPRCTEAVSIYDMREKRMYQILLQRNGKLGDSLVSTFSAYVEMGRCLYLIPYNYRFLVMIDMETDAVEYYPVPLGKEGKPVGGSNGMILGGNIFFAHKTEGCLVRFDTESKTMDKVFPANEKRTYSNLFRVDDKLWLIPADVDAGVRVWNTQTDEFEEIIAFPHEVTEKPKESEIGKFPEAVADSLRQGEAAYFLGGILYGQEIHLLAYMLGRNVIIHTAEKKITSWDMDPDCFGAALYTWMRGLRYISYFHGEDGLYVISGLSGEWYRYKENRWEKVRKPAAIGGNKEKVLIMDGQELTDDGTEEIQHTSGMGEKIYWNLMET